MSFVCMSEVLRYNCGWLSADTLLMLFGACILLEPTHLRLSAKPRSNAKDNCLIMPAAQLIIQRVVEFPTQGGPDCQCQIPEKHMLALPIV